MQAEDTFVPLGRSPYLPPAHIVHPPNRSRLHFLTADAADADDADAQARARAAVARAPCTAQCSRTGIRSVLQMKNQLFIFCLNLDNRVQLSATHVMWEIDGRSAPRCCAATEHDIARLAPPTEPARAFVRVCMRLCLRSAGPQTAWAMHSTRRWDPVPLSPVPTWADFHLGRFPLGPIPT